MKEIADYAVSVEVPEEVGDKAYHCKTTVPNFCLGSPPKEKHIAIFTVV
jgi:hypothetical protein